jgi:hypothetical protein
LKIRSLLRLKKRIKYLKYRNLEIKIMSDVFDAEQYKDLVMPIVELTNIKIEQMYLRCDKDPYITLALLYSTWTAIILDLNERLIKAGASPGLCHKIFHSVLAQLSERFGKFSSKLLDPNQE